MEPITDFYLFMASVIFISLSGVMAPGPLLAVTIEKAVESKISGVLIAFGHGIVEFPLMFLIYFGFTQLLVPEAAQVGVGLIGGLIMVYFGIQTVRTGSRNKPDQEYKNSKHGSLTAGVLATGANPYFIIWWLTVGTALIMNSKLFGFASFSLFAAVHWLCDFTWYTLVALIVFKSQRFWTKRVHDAVTLFCFAILMGFGVWFIISALRVLYPY